MDLDRTEMIMDSPVLQEIYQDGVAEGLIKDRQAVILDIVMTRFALPHRREHLCQSAPQNSCW